MKPGDKLWLVYNERYSTPDKGREVTVATVGRKWASLSDSWPTRINIQTMEVDGGNYSSTGKCYASEEAYKTHLNDVAAWKDFWQKVRSHSALPEGVTAEMIQAARKVLNL